MMRFSRSFSTLLLTSLCLLLIYSLAISLCAPLAIVPVRATIMDKTMTEAAMEKASRPAPGKAQAHESRWREGELLVRFRERAPVSKMNALLRANGAEWNGRLRGQSGIERIRLSQGADPELAATNFRASELIAYAEPNYLLTADQTATEPVPNDARFAEQWSLQNTEAQRAWAWTTASKQTVIAVIDGGIDFSHPELINNQWNNSLEQANHRDNDGNGFTSDLHGWDFVTDSSRVIDEEGHGTAVAGIIAAEGNNRHGITGIMWQASLMSLRILDKNGTGDIAAAVEAIDYATSNGAQVINCSWGTGGAASHALREAIKRAGERGVIVVTSAGNTSHDIETFAHYPASYDLPNLLVVAATDHTDSLARFSNWGATHVSIAAPGQRMLTIKPGGDFQTLSGTSLSASLVTAIAGLIKSLRPWLSAEQTREVILRGARNVQSLSGKVACQGVVSAAGAAEALKTLPLNEGLDETNGNNGGAHGDGDGRGRQRPKRPGDSRRGDYENPDDRQLRATPSARTEGAPVSGLPNLDELRNKRPVKQQTPAAIPSTRCSHKEPNCASFKRQAAIEPLDGLLAWGLDAQLMPALYADRSHAVSDSPWQLFWSLRAYLPAPLPQTQASRVNVALAANGSTASASSTIVYNGNPFPASRAIDGDRRGLNYLTGGVWHGSAATFPQWLQIDFSSSKTIDEIDLFMLQDNYASPIEPTEGMLFSWYGLTAFEVQSWNGSAWVTISGGSVTGNTHVWKRLTFAPITTSKIRVIANGSPDGYSRLAEVEAWEVQSPRRINFAKAANGGVASASSVNVYNNNSFPASRAIDGDHRGLNYMAGGVWQSDSASFPQWLQVDFNGSKTIDEIDVYTLQDDYSNPIEPTEATTFIWYGLTAFEVQYWNGSAWMIVPGGSVTGNNKVWRKLTFPAITTNKIRVLPLASPDAWSRIAEVEAWGTSTAVTGNSFSVERLDPRNRTGGGGGVDLLSGNVNWSLPLLGIKGRAGLDLGLALSYNSLVWTKSQDGTAIKFDADQGTPAPGFRLGFPVIQPRYYNSQLGANAYLLITPSGAHVELRQVGTSHVYESADSSYLQLIDNGSNLTLRPTDGSQFSYDLKNGQYHCTQIKDRNGNFMTIKYEPINGVAGTGRMTSIVDTLGRTIDFNYDAYLNLNSITQSWGALTRSWATFGWSNLAISTGFNGLTVIGPQNGAVIPVLTQVAFADGTRYGFEYNSYAQVFLIRHYAADNHQRAFTFYTLTANPSDCPRAIARKVWAEHWNDNLAATSAYSTALDFSSGQTTLPDGSIYKERYGTSGWQRGLTLGTEFWSGAVKKKWTENAYTQDNPNLNYSKNPRLIETNVYDSDNKHKRTKINYDLYAAYGLPHYVDEYDSDGVTLLRRTYTDYNLSQAYLDRRIIGLPSAVHVSDGTGWQAKVKYEYDAGGDQLQPTAAPTTQHDSSYGTGFTVGRGNLTAISRYNVMDSNNESLKLVTRAGYDTNGSVIFTRDPLGHQTSISYTDSFSDGVSRNTFAYPTIIKDAENNASFTLYNYDFGAPTRTEKPPPAGHAQGEIQTYEYDAAGRTTRVNNLVNNAYQRWVYDPYGGVITYTTVQTGAPETFQVTYLDGAGRVMAQGGDLPHSAGLYRARYFKYDIMGRTAQASNPGEMNGNWMPAGDDAAGWVWTRQSYDWQGRPTITTNPDGTTKEITYGGCGCAGGEVVTIKDETGRRQRVISDALGRPVKTEVLNHNQSVYSRTTNAYNARDQITSIFQQDGDSGAGQTTTLTYDGYGRLQTKQSPEQTSATTYVYNDDDNLKSVTDARGVVSTFTYNDRHLLTGIAYSAPAGITATAHAAFAYDARGNRTSMADGSGSVTYSYDRLSRLTSEARQFNGLPGTFNLSYSYNLAGALTSITDPTGAVINYSYDLSGGMTDITGSSFAGVTQYMSGARYRAWGAAKSASYGDKTALAISYNERLLPTAMSVTNNLLKHYEYYDDGRLRYTRDNGGSMLDRSYTYDHAGRVTEAFSGPMARGEADVNMRPYRFYYTYDAFNHLTSRTGQVWSSPSEANNGTGVYINNKNTGWAYDPDGRLADSGETQYAYDAAGRAVSVVSLMGDITQVQTFDAAGERTKLLTTQVIYQENAPQTSESQIKYFVTSSVLGRVVTELDQSGKKSRTFVYNGGQVLAWQEKDGSRETVAWEHRDLSNASATGAAAAELDPFGSAAGPAFTPNPRPVRPTGALEDVRVYPGYSDATSGECQLDGIDTPCSMVQTLKEAGALAHETLIRRANGRWERHQDAIIYHGIGISTTFTYRIDARTREMASDRIFVHLPQNAERLSRETVNQLRGNLQKFLADKDCREFLDATLTSLPSQRWQTERFDGSLLDAFDRIDSGGGFWSGDVGKYRATGNPNTLSVTFHDQRTTPLITSDRSHERFSSTETLIHELTHLFTKAPNAGVYGHIDMARAARDAADKLGVSLGLEFPTTDQYGVDDAYSEALSTYFYRAVSKACRKVKS